jgi:hypothetical protein
LRKRSIWYVFSLHTVFNLSAGLPIPINSTNDDSQPAIQANPALALKAVYSRSLASAKSLSEGLNDVELYSEDKEGAGLDELLKRDDIKGVVIA